jgi:hypothetical protein
MDRNWKGEIMTDILNEFFKPRQAPALAVDERTYTAEEWFTFLFSARARPHKYYSKSDKKAEDGSADVSAEKTLDKRIILLGHLLNDLNMFTSYAEDIVGSSEQSQVYHSADASLPDTSLPDIDASLSDVSSNASSNAPFLNASRLLVEHAVMRDLMLEKTGKAPVKEAFIGHMVIDYAALIVKDSTYFKNVYFGKVSLDGAVKKMRYKPAAATSPTPGTTLHATPEQNLAAKTLLELYPIMNMNNPPVASLAELNQMLVANIIYSQIKSEPVRQMVHDAVARPELSVGAKLMHAAFMFHIGYVQFMDEAIRNAKTQ